MIGENEDQRVERHVCVLSVGRMTDLEIPPGIPWMQRTDQLGFPVEWSARVEVEDSAKVGMAMRRNIQKIRAQKDHYEVEHHEPAPGALDRQADKALTVEDEISMGLSGLSTRTTGWYRIAVSGASEEEALERASLLRKLYAPQITIARPADQYAIAREFIPGEKLGIHGIQAAYAGDHPRRRRPRRHREGRRPGRHPPRRDVRHLRPGRHLGAVGEHRDPTRSPGSRSCARAWAGASPPPAATSSTAPSCRASRGPCSTPPAGSPRCAGCRSWPSVSQAIDLLDAPPGALCTYRVIAEPRREHYDAELDWRAAQDQAEDTRRLLTSSVLRAMLPRQLQDHVLTEVALMRAVGAVLGQAHRIHPRGRRRTGAGSTATPSCAGTPATWPTSCARPPRPATAG